MTVRTAFAAAIFAASVAAFAAPASAQAVGTFGAWGHTYTVPGAQVDAARAEALVTTGAISNKSAYASANTASQKVAAPAQVVHTINVWGAQVEAPAY